MAAPKPSTGTAQAKRKIASHRKSRQGCRNCKLRKIKCDESRPSCAKCQNYGILCNYDRRHSDLQMSNTGASAIDVGILDFRLAESSNSVSQSTTTSRSDGLESSWMNGMEDYRPTAQDLEILSRYYSRTIHTPGSSESRHCYREVFPKLTGSNPCLFHIVLAVTLVHDTYIKQSCSPSDFEAIAEHWSLGATLLNQAISEPVTSLSSLTRDAMWACAAWLGCLAFSILDAETAEQSWPLKPSEPGDLSWLKFCEGKSAIFRLSDPCRADSLFAPIREEMAQFMSYRTDLSVADMQKTLPHELIELCNFLPVPAHMEMDNPYWAPMSLLAQLIPLECTQDNYVLFIGFFRTLQTGYKQLLSQKDPAAMLLLLFWYAKILTFKAWWLEKRARLESRAISIYLQQHHPDDTRVMRLVNHVQSVFGV